MIYAPSGKDRDGRRFHHVAQNSMRFKTDELIISEIAI